MLLSTALAAIYLLAAVAPTNAASGRSGLHRRRCRASHGGISGGGAINVGAAPTSSPEDEPEPTPKPPKGGACFPSANFDVPDSPNGISVNDWWCSPNTEYAFMGFSWPVTDCPSKSSMIDTMKQMKKFDARYVRLYGNCDRGGWNDDLVDAAYQTGMGVFYLVWFGFTGGDEWKGRLSDILKTIDSNPRAKYVIRTVTLGSEALFDHAISSGELANQLGRIRDRVNSKGIIASTSEMAYLLKDNKNVIDASGNVQLNVLPFFAGDATTGSNARSRVVSDVDGIVQASNRNKKIFLTQTGWPVTDEVWKANSHSAVASVSSSAGYYKVLDGLCDEFKGYPKGGVGWFAHTWSDAGLPGWGVTRGGGQAKFDFNPRTKC